MIQLTLAVRQNMAPEMPPTGGGQGRLKSRSGDLEWERCCSLAFDARLTAGQRWKINHQDMTSRPPSERRQYERLHLELPLHFTRMSGCKVVDCVSINISCQGVYFISPEPILSGERLQIDLQLPSLPGREELKAHLRCRAKVVRVDSSSNCHGFGVACRIDQFMIRFEETEFRRDPMH